MKIEDYSKYYIQGSDHYLMPKDVFKELFGEMLNWKDESKKQKEFIKYLEDNIKHYKEFIKSNGKDMTEQDHIRFEKRLTTFQEILQKYKKIIGVSDDNKTTI